MKADELIQQYQSGAITAQELVEGVWEGVPDGLEGKETMPKFCKVFETEEYGQILVKIDHHPETAAPEIRFYVQPGDLGVCTIATSYEDTGEGWDRAEKIFGSVDETRARTMAAFIIKAAGLR